VRCPAPAAALAALALVPAGARAMTMAPGDGGPAVAIAYASFGTPRLDVLAGDTVTWTNDSVRAHTVTADDGSFDSDRLAGGATFHRRFDAVGATTYYCRLHGFMRGEVDVSRVLLTRPAEPAAPGRPFALAGRAAADPGAAVSIQADMGGGFREVATATVAADGRLRATVVPTTSASYRAVVGADASPPVALLVLDRRIAAVARTRARRATVTTTVTPASPGATVVLQLRLRDRFGWWPVARAKVGRDGRATLLAPVGRRVRARVVLTLADGATVLARTAPFQLGP
jgi:plastocyanin